MPIWCPTKINHKVAFSDIHNKLRIFKVNNESTKKEFKNLPKVNENLKTTWQKLSWYLCCENFDRSHTQCNASSIYLEQTDVCRVDIHLIFKMRGKKKRPILNVNQKKYTRQILHLIIDLVKIMNKCKLQPIFAKRFILDVSQVLSLPLTTINQAFSWTAKELYHKLFY